MTMRLAPQAASSVASRKHLENARFAVTLGAAFAILCATIFGYDTPESFAAGGLFDLLFNGGGGGYAVPSAPYVGYGGGYGYGYGGRHYGHARRHARRHRTHYAQSRHHVAEHRRSAVAERRAADRRLLADGVRAEGLSARRVASFFDNERRLGATLNDHRLLSPTERGPDKRAANGSIANVTMSNGSMPSGPIETISYAEMSSPAATPSQSLRTVCVRSCDGYFFPIANNSSRPADIGAQQSCEKLCPGAAMQVFNMPAGATKIDEAVAAQGGETYAQLVARLTPEDGKSKSCACPQTAGNLHESSAFLSDLTLRPGDTVVTPQGVRVVRRGSHYPFKKTDFLSLAETRDLSRSTKGALYAIERAMKTPYGRLAVAANADRRHHHRDGVM